MKTRFILVRHGQSLGNERKIILGHVDWDITDIGRAQAQCVARALENRKIDAVYSSDLMRAYNTVAPMATSRGLNITADEGLREINMGLWQGRTVADIIEEYGELFTVRWKCHFGSFCAPDGESTQDLAKRVRCSLLRIAEENPERTVLIGTHAAAIRAFWALVTGVPAEKIDELVPFPDNASYSEIDCEDGVFNPISYSVSDYLTTIATGLPF